VTSNKAPAHPHATGVAVYLALLMLTHSGAWFHPVKFIVETAFYSDGIVDAKYMGSKILKHNINQNAF